MTTKIQSLDRSQVQQALISWNQMHDKPVPDFTTRIRTCFVWSKIYISLVDNKVDFVELNFFQRMIRHCSCLGFYEDTILEKKTRDKVVSLIHDILIQPGFQDILVLQKQIQCANAPSDFIYFKAYLEARIDFFSKQPFADNKDVDQIAVYLKFLLSFVESKRRETVREHFKDDYLSDELLDQAFKLAKDHKKTEQNIQIWKVIEENLKLNPDTEKGKLNIALFQELIRVLQEPVNTICLTSLPCQGVEVQEHIKEKMAKGIESIENHLKLTTNPSTWREYFDNYQMLVQFNETMSYLRNHIKMLLQDDKEALVAKLRQKLLDIGVHEVLVNEYLSDEKRLDERIFYHTELARDEADFSKKSKATLESIDALGKTMRDKIEKEYQAKPNVSAGDCFFLSCDDLVAPREGTTWREKIADCLIRKKNQYSLLVISRIATDNQVPKEIDFDTYCEWIQERGNWGGQPELEAFSEIVKQPVIVVQSSSGKPFEWSASFNLDCKGDPLIFLNHSACHYEAMLKKS